MQKSGPCAYLSAGSCITDAECQKRRSVRSRSWSCSSDVASMFQLTNSRQRWPGGHLIGYFKLRNAPRAPPGSPRLEWSITRYFHLPHSFPQASPHPNFGFRDIARFPRLLNKFRVNFKQVPKPYRQTNPNDELPPSTSRPLPVRTESLHHPHARRRPPGRPRPLQFRTHSP